MSTSSKRRRTTLGVAGSSAPADEQEKAGTSSSILCTSTSSPEKKAKRSKLNFPRLKLVPGSCSITLAPPEIVLDITPKVKVGRSLDNNYCVNLHQISRYHCEFYEEDNQWMVKNLSVNGLRVNNQIVLKDQSKAIMDGDTVNLILAPQTPIYTFIAVGNVELDEKEKEEKVVIEVTKPETPTPPEPSVVVTPETDPKVIERENLLKELKEAESKLDLLETKAQLAVFDSIAASFASPETSMMKAKVAKLELELAETLKESEQKKEKTVKIILGAMKSYFRCSECDQILIKALILDCEHVFCEYCYNKANADSTVKKCPHCFQQVQMKVEHFVLRNMVDQALLGILPESWVKARQELLREREEEVKAFEQDQKQKQRDSIVVLDSVNDSGRPGPSGIGRPLNSTVMNIADNDGGDIEVLPYPAPAQLLTVPTTRGTRSTAVRRAGRPRRR